MFGKIQQIANEETKYYWGDWQALRNSYTRIFERSRKKFGWEEARVLLLGAGNGNDIPVDYIEAKFEEIVIADIDQAALGRFLAKARDRSKYKTVKIDLSGISEDLTNSNIYKLSIEEKIKFISRLQPAVDFSVVPGIFDLVINCNYTTQLVSPYFLWQRNKENPIPDIFYETVAGLTERIQSDIFKKTAKILKPKGSIIHSTDFLELTRDPSDGTCNYNWHVVWAAINGKWDKINKIARLERNIISGKMNICGSQLPEDTISLFNHGHTDYLVWHFSRNDSEEKKYIIRVDSFMNKN